jgi:predicted NACHT family NTPase
MEFEGKLEQRELRFQQTCRESKSLNQIFSEHENFFKEYLRKCISFHSKIQVRGIVEDLNNCGISFTEESRKYLKYIEIPLDCSNRFLQDIHSQTMVNNFLPSLESRFDESDSSEIFEENLRYERWLVILGDPGSAKTSLLRWITHIFAKAIYHGDQEVILKPDRRTTIRIPILIRIGEFVTWLDQHKNKTLIDYIGKHTWFSEPYISDDSGNVFQELIYHGYGLILLDGLDEISDVGRRGEIVDLVKNFIDEHVRAPDYVSAFDDRIFTLSNNYDIFFETQSPLNSGGNHIIITSRKVGYQLHPLIGPFIRHYSLLLIDHNEAKTFANNWMEQVEKSVDEILLNEGTMESFWKRRFQTIETMFENRSKLLLRAYEKFVE